MMVSGCLRPMSTKMFILWGPFFLGTSPFKHKVLARRLGQKTKALRGEAGIGTKTAAQADGPGQLPDARAPLGAAGAPRARRLPALDQAR